MTDLTKKLANPEEGNPFISLKNILGDEEFDNITIGELATAIDAYGIYTYDTFDRLVPCKFYSKQGQEVMTLLREFKFHDPYYNEEHGIQEYDRPPLDDIINENFGKYPSEPQTYPSRYNYFGWLQSDLPATLSIALNQLEANTDNQEQVKGSKPTIMDESTHDPAKLTVIANMFIVNQVPTDNLEQWKKFAKDAKRNGLYKARLVTGKGKAQSIYDPVAVGDWLISKGKCNMFQAKVNRTLMNNLPTRSAHLKDLYKD